jgi:hypothetical protein
VIGEGHFVFHYDEAALDYEEQLLVGRYVLATSLSAAQASASEVLRAYRRTPRGGVDVPGAQELHRPASRLPLDRSPGEGHVAVCVLGAVIEALIEADLRRGDVCDPDLADQVLSPRLALRELGRIRAATILAGMRSQALSPSGGVRTRPVPCWRKVLRMGSSSRQQLVDGVLLGDFRGRSHRQVFGRDAGQDGTNDRVGGFEWAPRHLHRAQSRLDDAAAGEPSPARQALGGALPYSCLARASTPSQRRPGTGPAVGRPRRRRETAS